MKGPYKKWRDQCVLFLDDAFDAESCHGILTQAGYLVERFATHFPDVNRQREQSVGDSRVIQMCNRNGWLLVTTDSEMIKVHRPAIELATRLGILASSHNQVDDIAEWAQSLVKLKPRVEREFKKRERPWWAQFNRSGTITVIYSVERR